MDELEEASAFDFTPKELADLTRELNARIDRMTLHPHQRLGIPPICQGKDVCSGRLTVESTVEMLKRKAVN